MASNRTKSQNLELIKTRLQVDNLPSKFKALSSNVIAIFAEEPSLDPAIQVIIDQNNTIKSANGRRLVAENRVESLKLKIEEFINPSKSELIKLWQKFFGKATQTDDEVLREIGVVSQETARQDIEKAEKVVEEAIDIVEKVNEKYG
ncbi:MAG: hypothetical protein QNJ33_18825 [Crocosphaera sp.]|nr:hypothetical protein [Crocosphaera sp.]